MNFLNYDSKFMQLMLKFADYILLNLIFMACCVPVFTIGAAQAGLYSGLRVLQDKENDASCLKAFFHGFVSGFGTITLVWGVCTVLIALLGYNALAVYAYEYANFVGASVPFWMSVVAAGLCVIFQSMLTIFHASFGCTARQLVRNVFFVILAHPLRSVAVAVLAWAPALLLALNFPVFLQISIALIFLYYSVAFGLSVRLMAKPFGRLAENFRAGSGSAPEDPEPS